MHIPHGFFILSLAVTLGITGCAPQPDQTPMPTPISTPHPSAIPIATNALETITGSFRNQISALEENMPRTNSEGFVAPTGQEKADFAELTSSLLGANDLARASQLAVKNNYSLTYYVDRGDDNAVNYLLREDKPIQKGWGLYAIRADSTSNIIIEAPHPLYDRRTPSVALNIYRALDARAFLIAGAHRNANSDGSADMAHTAESIFQSAHEALSQEIQIASGNVIVLQIHGFHTSKHAGYPQVVFGFGEKIQPSELNLAQKLGDALSEHGVIVGLCTGDVWQDLCGTTNTQASTMNGGVFIHIELDEDIRKHNDALIAALVQVFGK